MADSSKSLGDLWKCIGTTPPKIGEPFENSGLLAAINSLQQTGNTEKIKLTQEQVRSFGFIRSLLSASSYIKVNHLYYKPVTPEEQGLLGQQVQYEKDRQMILNSGPVTYGAQVFSQLLQDFSLNYYKINTAFTKFLELQKQELPIRKRTIADDRDFRLLSILNLPRELKKEIKHETQNQESLYVLSAVMIPNGDIHLKVLLLREDSPTVTPIPNTASFTERNRLFLANQQKAVYYLVIPNEFSNYTLAALHAETTSQIDVFNASNKDATAQTKIRQYELSLLTLTGSVDASYLFASLLRISASPGKSTYREYKNTLLLSGLSPFLFASNVQYKHNTDALNNAIVASKVDFREPQYADFGVLPQIVTNKTIRVKTLGSGIIFYRLLLPLRDDAMDDDQYKAKCQVFFSKFYRPRFTTGAGYVATKRDFVIPFGSKISLRDPNKLIVITSNTLKNILSSKRKKKTKKTNTNSDLGVLLPPQSSTLPTDKYLDDLTEFLTDPNSNWIYLLQEVPVGFIRSLLKPTDFITRDNWVKLHFYYNNQKLSGVGHWQSAFFEDEPPDDGSVPEPVINTTPLGVDGDAGYNFELQVFKHPTREVFFIAGNERAISTYGQSGHATQQKKLLIVFPVKNVNLQHTEAMMLFVSSPSISSSPSDFPLFGVRLHFNNNYSGSIWSFCTHFPSGSATAAEDMLLRAIEAFLSNDIILNHLIKTDPVYDVNGDQEFNVDGTPKGLYHRLILSGDLNQNTESHFTVMSSLSEEAKAILELYGIVVTNTNAGFASHYPKAVNSDNIGNYDTHLVFHSKYDVISTETVEGGFLSPESTLGQSADDNIEYSDHRAVGMHIPLGYTKSTRVIKSHKRPGIPFALGMPSLLEVYEGTRTDIKDLGDKDQEVEDWLKAKKAKQKRAEQVAHEQRKFTGSVQAMHVNTPASTKGLAQASLVRDKASRAVHNVTGMIRNTFSQKSNPDYSPDSITSYSSLQGKRATTAAAMVKEAKEHDANKRLSKRLRTLETKPLIGGSINKIQLIKEQIKIIKDKYKNTKLDKYLIQIDNLKHKIILQTFTDKLLKIKEQIKNYKTEMKANPNKKDKYIKNIDKLVERFNVLKQEQDTLKQNIKLKPTKDPKPTKNPTKDPKSTKISKPTTPSKPTKNPTKNPLKQH
jgi:hypothetical protein